MSVYKSNGEYRYQYTWGDLDETEGTLAELQEWLSSQIKRHGLEAKFTIEHPLDGEGRASYCIDRKATAEEIAEWEARQAQAEKDREARERAEFERLRSKFEADKS